MNRVLHVAAVIESSTPAAWVVDLIQRLTARENIVLAVVTADGSSNLDSGTADRDGVSDGCISGLSRWWMMHAVDRPLFNHDPWLATDLPDGITTIPLDSQSDALAQIDVIINLCSQHLAPPALCRSDVPCWTAQIHKIHERVEHYLLHNAPLMWLHLWNIRHDPTVPEQRASRLSSHALPRHTYSISDLKRLCYASLPALFESRLNWMANSDNLVADIESQELQQGMFNAERDAAKADASRWQETTSVGQITQSLTHLILVARVFGRQLVERLRARFMEESWQLAIHEDTSDSLELIETLSEIDQYRDLANSKDVVWADPHIVSHRAEQYLFFEKMHKHNNSAHIAVAKVDASGALGKPSIALQEDFHLSYPFVFEHEDRYFMIPETGALNTIRLYESTVFPHSWQPVTDLVKNVNAADSTLLFHEDSWWMFTSCQSHRCVDERDELHLYYADDPSGRWQAHPLNPVLTGVDRSRMAGSIVTRRGVSYRISQYGAHRYGYGINISRIDELSRTTYRETALHRITPDPDSTWQGCHTLGFSNGFAVIDRMRYRRKHG